MLVTSHELFQSLNYYTLIKVSNSFTRLDLILAFGATLFDLFVFVFAVVIICTRSQLEMKSKCNQSYPFITPIAKPAASPPVRGMPRFPVIVEICPVSVNEWASVDISPCDID